jgi:16S rRNA (cytidine1402-2'-O)-methyltransferase
VALWIVATPIGTLGDLSPRAREVLGSAAMVACEDTRTTRRLLSAAGITAPALVAVHAHNEAEVADRVAARALVEEVALVSDAGTPGVSDPGAVVVAAAHRAGVRVLSVPGPSALAAALAASGFPAAPSAFLGFPPRKGRDGWCREALARPETFVVYEAPSRVADLLGLLAALVPDREACVAREISKTYEEVRRGRLADLATGFAGRDEVRGECVVVVGPGEALAPERADLEGEGLKDVARVLADRWGRPRRDVYQRLLAWEREP